MSDDATANERAILARQTSTVSLAATATTSNVLLPNKSPDGSVGGGPSQVEIYNAGSVSVFVNFGGSAVTAVLPNGATPGDYPVAPGAVVVVTVAGARPMYAAVICPSAGTATVYFSPGDGL